MICVLVGVYDFKKFCFGYVYWFEIGFDVKFVDFRYWVGFVECY